MPNDRIRISIPQGLIVAALIGGAAFAWRVGQATDSNTAAILAKADKTQVERIAHRQVEQARGINWIGESVEKIAAKLDIDLPPRPIVSEEP